ncbi:MAG: thioester reductase, partial [Bacteroidetes bacterium]|nr:thioester reductase [Bacteroidota bacterium]
DFKSWIVNTIANKLKVPCEEIDVEASFSSFGFGSLESVEFSGQLEEWLGQRISPAILYDYSNIKDLTEYLVSEAGNSKPDRHHKQNEEQNTENEAVAIIGMYGIMPQSEDPDHFWEHLEEGRNLVTEVPEERWDWKSLSQERSGARWGAFIRDIDKFDNTFFDISQDEADVMDPQQRIFLETVWKTIENAGYRPSELSGTKTGVFAGVANTDYTEIIKTSASGLNPAALTGNSYSIIANRVSYHLNLRGPSESINTACSSALVAIQRGVESIQSGICSMAIAGGVNAILTPSISVAFDLSRSLAKDGRCKTFDKRADGYVRGEGVGALLLKPLKSAIAEGDHVYAVIRGAGSNHGGRSHSLSAPNAQSQRELLVNVYEQAKIDPGTIGYI